MQTQLRLLLINSPFPLAGKNLTNCTLTCGRFKLSRGFGIMINEEKRSGALVSVSDSH